jgi:hypothetical protein
MLVGCPECGQSVGLDCRGGHALPDNFHAERITSVQRLKPAKRYFGSQPPRERAGPAFVRTANGYRSAPWFDRRPDLELAVIAYKGTSPNTNHPLPMKGAE